MNKMLLVLTAIFYLIPVSTRANDDCDNHTARAERFRAVKGVDRCKDDDLPHQSNEQLKREHVYELKVAYQDGHWVESRKGICKVMFKSNEGDLGEIQPGSFILGGQFGDTGSPNPTEVDLVIDTEINHRQHVEFGCSCDESKDFTMLVSFNYEEPAKVIHLNDLLPTGGDLKFKTADAH